MSVKADDLNPGDKIRYDGGARGSDHIVLRLQARPGDVFLVIDTQKFGAAVVESYQNPRAFGTATLSHHGSLRHCSKVIPTTPLRGPDEVRVGDRMYVNAGPGKGSILVITSVGTRSFSVAGFSFSLGSPSLLRVLTGQEVRAAPDGTKVIRVREIGEGASGAIVTLGKGTGQVRPTSNSDLAYALVSLPVTPEEEKLRKLLRDIAELKSKLAEMEREASK